jgi:ABC-type branched-subunit amino acid transport system substrate-binding protein
LIAAFAALSMTAAACGQLPGVHQEFASGTGATQDDLGVGPAAGEGAAGEETVGGATGGRRRTTVREGGAAGGGGTSEGTGTAAPGAGDRTGIFRDRIVIGIHAPVTGAAPVQAQAFESGKDLYWRWLERKGQSVFGRKVEVVFKDDTYSPSVAAQRCQEMAQRNKAFLLIGGAGTDQIAACARYTAQNGIPYLSAGVTEEGVAPYKSYFAISASYRSQGPILAQMLLRKFGASRLDQVSPGGIAQPDGQVRIAMIRANTPNFDDAEAGFRQGLQQAGFNMSNFFVYNLPKEDSPTLRSAIAAAIQDMAARGIDVVNTLIAPVVVIEFVQEADSRGYRPRYAAVGISTVNQVSNILCQSAPESYDGADVFFPWPGWPEVMQGRFDPEFRQAVEAFEDAQSVNSVQSGGDILLSLWGTMKVVHQMFLAAGPEMTRQSFVSALEGGKLLSTGVYPDLRYSASQGAHFGTKSVYRLEVECGTDRAFHYREGPVSGY